MTHASKKLAGLLLAVTTLVSLLAGCSANAASSESSTKASSSASLSQTKTSSTASEPTSEATSKEGKVMVEMIMNDGGKVVLELDPEAAPLTVENFVNLVNEGFYDGLTFHRIISGFMIQGGDPEGTGMGGSDANVKGEFKANGWDNPISHKRGAISMARSQDPNSASSQFFIVHEDSTFLDGNYAAFGNVVEGMDVVDAIANVPTGANDAPVEPVVIKTIRVIDPASAE